MHRFTVSLALVLCSVWAASGSAQQVTTPEAQGTPPPSQLIITTAPNQTTAEQVYFDYDLQEAEERSRRVRVALISTSAVFGVGLILGGIGVSQCQYIERFDQTGDVLCNNAGDVLLPMGAGFLTAGAIGMLTSGIMLGVRNRQKRGVERDMRRRYYSDRVRWDAASGGLAF